MLAKMLDDSIVEIRSNALFFIEELPEEYFPYLGSKIKKLVEFLDETDHSSVIEAVLHILSKLWKSSLSIMLDVFESLMKIYKDTGHREKEDKSTSISRYRIKRIGNLFENRTKYPKKRCNCIFKQ